MPSAAVPCCHCEIVSDDYHRANSDNPGDYAEVGGSDYDIDSNELLCVTSGLLIHNTPHPGGPLAPARVSRRFKRSSTSQYAGVVIAYKDAGNYLYARVESIGSCDVLRIFQNKGG